MTKKIDGINIRDILNIEYEGHLALTAFHGCVYFSDGNPCKFCSIPKWKDSKDRSFSRLLKAVSLAIEVGDVRHISITSGTVATADRGIKHIVKLIDKITEHLGGDIALPVFAEFEPPEDLSWIELLREKGVTSVSCNIEFLCDKQRKQLMPGKGIIPFTEYERTWKYCAELFGCNQVFSNILLTSDTIDHNAIDNLDKMLAIGVIPSPGVLYPDPNSIISTAEMVSFEQQDSFLSLIAEKIVQVGLNPLRVKAGCCRNGAYSAVNEYYQHTVEQCRLAAVG